MHVLIFKLGTPRSEDKPIHINPNDAGTLEPSPNATESAHNQAQYSTGF